MRIVALISGRRYEFWIALSTAFGCQKVIVPAAEAVGIASADRRAGVIDCALALFRIEKLTDFLEDVVLLMS
jgi:hypothetical protein